ncbi:major facilitator superfamily domain-containing protein [Aspergillus pseudotamarii]|uniref:Major facilitator superfamily domain-containing protein n=1 Tax=Aspergillus pseudotamarii TaxID=132259 RepID=A0A5N6STJ9_ASPPS|nr:major facilitator superfamily domain-containing protein [Aspergillus pseudotamarii]KAE8136454.1 major facilitator superfamily domain-containing protein [Aspergillus pseudotamarii]
MAPSDIEASLDGDSKLEHVEGVENASRVDPELERRIVRKIDCRLLPTTAVIYLLCYLDRSNIGNAKILNSSTNDTLMDSNNVSNYQYTIAMMVFLVAYSVFEAPSNLALKIFQPHRWLGLLVIAFGCFCTGIGFTHDFAGLATLRFLLGAAEAGAFPGMIYYFTFWYKPAERASRIAVFMCSATLSGAFGGAIAYGGWRWLFLVEGVPTIAAGLLVFLFLPSYPEKVGWLTDEEKEAQALRLEANGSSGEDKLNWKDAKETLLSARLYIHYLTYLSISAGVASLSLFAPTIIAGLGYTDIQAQLFTVPPYAVAYVVTLGLAWLSDRLKCRGAIACGSQIAAAVAFIIQAEAYTARYAFLVIATTGTFGGLPSLNAWVGDNIHTTTARSITTALNISFSGPGQIIGVWIYRAQDAPAYRLGHGVNAGMSFLAASLAVGLTLYYRRQNLKMAGTSQTRWVA